MMNISFKKTSTLGTGVLLLSGVSLATLTVPVAKVSAAEPGAPAATEQDMQRWMQQRQTGYGGGGMGPGMMMGDGMGPGMMGMGGPGGMGMMGGGMMNMMMGHGGMGMMGGMGMGPGMMMGDGMGMMGMGRVWMLDLTDEQRDKIEKIYGDLRKKNWDAYGKIMDEQAKLRELYGAETVDSKKVGAAYAGIAKLQQQVIEANVEAQNRINAVLTNEQKGQLRQWQRGMWGPGDRGPRGGMDPGMMNR